MKIENCAPANFEVQINGLLRTATSKWIDQLEVIGSVEAEVLAGHLRQIAVHKHNRRMKLIHEEHLLRVVHGLPSEWPITTGARHRVDKTILDWLNRNGYYDHYNELEQDIKDWLAGTK